MNRAALYSSMLLMIELIRYSLGQELLKNNYLSDWMFFLSDISESLTNFNALNPVLGSWMEGEASNSWKNYHHHPKFDQQKREIVLPWRNIILDNLFVHYPLAFKMNKANYFFRKRSKTKVYQMTLRFN